MAKITTTLKTILVFKDGELIRNMRYDSKKDAIGNYKNYVKNGMLDRNTGEKIEGATFELL